MERGRYGNLTPAALARSQYISPGLLRQQTARRVYGNISSGTPIHNSTDEETNSAANSIKKATTFSNPFQVPKDASDDPEGEHGTGEWSEWNRRANDFIRRNQDAIDRGTSHAGRQNVDRAMNQDRLHTARSSDEDMAPDNSDSDQLFDNNNMETEEVQEDRHLAGDKSVKQKQRRGKNKCKKVAKLKAGDKIKVRFYNKRALSKTFSRQLGRLVRDTNIIPIRVKKWTDISPAARKHIFAAIQDKFENADQNIEIDIYEDEILEHARDLWNNWRGDLNRHFVKPARNMRDAIKNCPKEIPKSDWEWLVKEHFYTKEFMKTSKRNSGNRSNLKILHHSGSKPFREIIWDNGGNESNPPTLDTLFSITHTKGGTFVDSEASSKHAHIQEQKLLNPSLSNVELVDKCFPSKRRDHVVGYGGGIKARDLRGPAVTKAELIDKLAQSEQAREALQEDNQVLHEENRKVNNRMSRMEEEWAQMKKHMSANYSQHDSPGSAGTRDHDEY